MRTMPTLDLSRWFAGIAAREEPPGEEPSSPENDARIRTAVTTLPVTMFEFDADGIYTCVAGGYIGLFGITPSRLVGRSVFHFPKFVPGKNLMVRRALAGESVSFTGLWPRGRFMIRLTPRFDAAGRVTAVAGIGFELAKPAKADAHFEQLLDALRQSEARFRAMCECAPLGICVANPALELGYVNPALCAMFGRSPAELLGRKWETVLEEHAVTRTDTPPHPRALEGTWELRRSDGSPIWVALRVAEMRDDGELIGYVATSAEVTQEHTAQRAVDRAQQDLRRLIECSPEGIAVLRDGRFISLNRALAEALGFEDPAALLGRPLDDVVHPTAHASESAGSSHADPCDGVHELRCRRDDGEYALLEARQCRLTEFDGAPAELLTARDVTERRKREATLQMSERLLVVGTLAAGVAHEINNPLGAVASHVEWASERLARLLCADPPLDAAELRGALELLRKPLEDAREATGRMRAIMRDLKLFSRAESEQLTTVDVNVALDSAVRMAWNELRHRARLVRDYGEVPAVLANEARLGQVILNLLINAAQAIPEGNADAHRITLSARAHGDDRVVIEVRDTGSGIAPDVVGRIFDPFFTTKPPGVGTGLGLSICQRLATAMGGHIEVESRLEHGSAFRVHLARATAQARSVARDASSRAPSSTQRGRVLVIDDDAPMASAIGLVLADDHAVEVTTSARWALARVREGERYDAIVCDVMMPDMTGMEFHEALATSHPDLAHQVIFLTGGAFTAAARTFLSGVDNPRLDKPFESGSLRALVASQVARASAEAHPRGTV